MNHATNAHAAAVREASRQQDGRFGGQSHSIPEIVIERGSFSVIPDEICGGDTLLVDGQLYLASESWVLSVEPETHIVATDKGYLRLDRETLVSIVRTGDEPDPTDHPDYAGVCMRCGQKLARDHNQSKSHIHPRGGRDYEADANHIAYSIEDYQ